MEMTPKLRQAIKDYKAGKADSFTSLYEESSKYIYTCIYKVLSGNDNAQELINDMMQDTYVEISRSLSQLEDEERFLSWAGTIATRKCYAYIKKNKKYVLLNEEDDTFENLSDSDDIIPEEVMQSKEKQRLVREIIETQLTEMQKLCIIAYYYNEQKQSEIAEELGIPENTVKTNLSRAKAKIKEGVLDLEKNKGTKLYSVAPLFLLLFKEDIMAAVVPKEIGVSIVTSVADAGVKAAETGVNASSASTSAASSSGTASGTASTVASKAGVLGKIAAASTKARILMVVATVSVAGVVGGGVMVASQNGLFSNAPIVNETQEADESQDVSEELLTTETEEIQTTEEQSQVTDLDVPYIEYSYYSSYRNELVHFKVAYLPDEVWNGENRDNAECLCRRSMIDHGEEFYEKFYFRVFPMGDIASCNLDLKNMSDVQIGGRTGGIADYSTLERVETETSYMAFIEYDIEMDMEEFKGYDLFINDYTTGKAYMIKLNRTAKYHDSQLALNILKSFRILPEESYKNTFVAASGEYIRFNIDLPLGEMEDRSSDSVLVKRTIEELDGGMSHRFYIKMAPRGSKENWLDLDAMSDAEFMSRVERPIENGNAYVERIKTDTYHMVYIWYDAKVDGQPMGGCEGYIYDYVNDKGYLVYLYESADFYSEANFRHILDSLEIEGITK